MYRAILDLYMAKPLFNAFYMFNGQIYQADDILSRQSVEPVPPGPEPGPGPIPSPGPFTIRCKFVSGVTPTMGDTQTLVDESENIWDITKNSENWDNLLSRSNIVEIVDANTAGVTSMNSIFELCSSLTSVNPFDTSTVTSMERMFSGCESLQTIPTLNISSVTNMDSMFMMCLNVQSGAYNFYVVASTKEVAVTEHNNTFNDCGRYTDSGFDELKQIPKSWGGLKS